MTVRVANHLAKKRVVRNMGGQIIDMFDETNGGWIIQKGRIVNKERWDELQKIEQDRREAAKAITFQKVDNNAPDRNVTMQEAVKNQSKMEELETRLNKQDEKLDAILKAITSK
jgi:seryl-tRNA synthetase